MKLLVVGARGFSLGAAVKAEAEMVGYQVDTAGINQEEHYLNLTTCSADRIRRTLRKVEPDHVVCTVGINNPREDKDPYLWYEDHFRANVIGPMRLLHEFAGWIVQERLDGDEYAAGDYLRHFIAISSNSAVIPRTASAAYCASKAALSQALRVSAREARGGDTGFIVYGYEPGWLGNTPMSDRVSGRFPEGGLHRMRGRALADGVSTAALAAQIVGGLNVPGAALNGALLRYDGGEL
jgi:NAD(P)-dependent dehydrogenase (short-subunit alcohol dehydrogenase family)